ncbi:MAG: LegC family aminotransferase [Candidatus Neomarinimicrobiota bacterium]|jgi:aminotransferase in exopolysaccharide biosynthesis|nr:LegC family aminotransferase [Candidatus Neomarinimicrobiota bacterium]
MIKKSASNSFSEIIDFIKSLYPEEIPVPLHAPRFVGREKEYVVDAIGSTFVSSVGEYVDRFEEMICRITGTAFAVATVNGTCALHIALNLAGVQSGDEVITQPLSFVATANTISYCGAKPIFLDVSRKTLGLDPTALKEFLKSNTQTTNQGCYNKATGKRIAACAPMHTFGHPCQIDSIAGICEHYNIALIEDAAESFGSFYNGRHTGTFGLFGVYSFNGNKTVTCGGGGAIVTNDETFAKKAKHITTTAKVQHPYEYIHDAIGYNYRLPNLNAALACAQLEQLDFFLENKRELAKIYQDFFGLLDIPFVCEPDYARSSFWLNAIILLDRKTRDEFLKATNEAKVMTRPVWKLLNQLEMYQDCQTDALINAQWLEDRVVNIPSSVRI